MSAAGPGWPSSSGWPGAGSSRFPDDPAGKHDGDRPQRDNTGEKTDQQLAGAHLRQPAARLPGEGDTVRDQVQGPIDDVRLDPTGGAADGKQDEAGAEP